MPENWRELKAGDRVRLLRVPEADLKQRERELRDGSTMTPSISAARRTLEVAMRTPGLHRTAVADAGQARSSIIFFHSTSTAVSRGWDDTAGYGRLKQSDSWPRSFCHARRF